MVTSNNRTIFPDDKVSPNAGESDYKGEVVAAGIIDSGLDTGQVYIHRLGKASRGYSKDIEYIEMISPNHDATLYMGVFANRPGIYDLLPEGLFHKIKSAPLNLSKEEIITEIRSLQKEENVGRQLFRPFELTIDNTLINAQLYERQLDKKYTNHNFVNIFSRMWPVINLLPLDKAILFIEIIPVIAKTSFSMSLVSSFMSALMDAPVNVKKRNRTSFKVDKTNRPRLREMRLGINAIIGDTFSDGLFYTEICIGPIPENKLAYYRTDKNGIRIINYLKDIFLPADSEVKYKYFPLPGTGKCLISENKAKASRLGINTYL